MALHGLYASLMDDTLTAGERLRALDVGGTDAIQAHWDVEHANFMFAGFREQVGPRDILRSGVVHVVHVVVARPERRVLVSVPCRVHSFFFFSSIVSARAGHVSRAVAGCFVWTVWLLLLLLLLSDAVRCLFHASRARVNVGFLFLCSDRGVVSERCRRSSMRPTRWLGVALSNPCM